MQRSGFYPGRDGGAGVSLARLKREVMMKADTQNNCFGSCWRERQEVGSPGGRDLSAQRAEGLRPRLGKPLSSREGTTPSLGRLHEARRWWRQGRGTRTTVTAAQEPLNEKRLGFREECSAFVF